MHPLPQPAAPRPTHDYFLSLPLGVVAENSFTVASPWSGGRTSGAVTGHKTVSLPVSTIAVIKLGVTFTLLSRY